MRQTCAMRSIINSLRKLIWKPFQRINLEILQVIDFVWLGNLDSNQD